MAAAIIVGLALYVGTSFLMAFWVGKADEDYTVGAVMLWPIILWSKAVCFFHARGEATWRHK